MERPGDELQVKTCLSQFRLPTTFIQLFTHLRQKMPPKAKVKSKEVEDTEMDCTRLFEALSLKCDEMNSNLEKRHGELCAKLYGLEEKTTLLATELKNLQETDLVDMKKRVKVKQMKHVF